LQQESTGLNPSAVLIIDDHELITGSLELLLAEMPEIGQCHIAGTLVEAREFLKRIEPELVLLDISLPDGSGLELLTELKTELPNCKIMLMSGHFTPVQLAQLARLPVEGLFSKMDSVEQLQEGMGSLLDGENYISSRVSEMLHIAGGENTLTPRQLEILQLVDAGSTNKEVARRTSLSASTVAFHLRELRIRLGVKSTREAIKLSRERGLIG
jgi:two-component system response regulator DesR